MTTYPLGRVEQFDPRSLNFLVAAPKKAVVPKSKTWTRYVPIFDQGHVGSCHDAETEILTSAGWLPFPDLTLDHKLATVNPRTSELTYERPARVIDLPWDGDIYAVRNKSKDFRVTPDHSMLVRKWDERLRTLSADYSFTPMRDVGWYSGLMSTVVWAGTPHEGTYTLPGIPGYKHAGSRGDLIVPMRAWLNFLGIYLAEGTMIRPTSKSPNKVQIAAFKDREKIFVRRVLADLGIHSTELRDRFTFENARVYRHLEALGLKGVYAAEKFVPAFVFDLPADDITALLEGHREGDGSYQNGTWTHHTSSPQLADDIQRLVFLAGGKTGRSLREPRTSTMRDGRVVTGRHAGIAVRHLAGLHLSLERANEVTTEHYTGRVYCAEVATHHTLVTRRNGKILISGNCTGNASAGLMGTAPLYGQLYAKRAAGLVINEALAVKLYSRATVLDPYPGTYPPQDTGSSSLAVSKAAQGYGYIKSYSWITGLDAAYTAILTSPFMVGVPWYQGMFTPDYNGVVHISGALAGGHEFEIVGYSTYYGGHWKCANSWGTGWGKSGYFYLDNPTLARLLSEQGDATVLTI